MQSIFYKIVECLLITFKLFCLVLEDSYKDFINVFVTELIWMENCVHTNYTEGVCNGRHTQVCNSQVQDEFLP